MGQGLIPETDLKAKSWEARNTKKSKMSAEIRVFTSPDFEGIVLSFFRLL
jgi:hypothetical protein